MVVLFKLRYIYTKVVLIKEYIAYRLPFLKENLGAGLKNACVGIPSMSEVMGQYIDKSC